MSTENTELIKKAQAGDKRAFEALLNGHYDLMFRFAFRYCRNQQDAEDITQNACIKLARSLESYKFKSAFTSWLYRLVINSAIDWQRQNNKDAAMPEPDGLQAPAQNHEDALYARQVLAQITTLPDNEKTALLLVFSEGLTHREAATVMECKESTVSWYIMEARKKLAVTAQGKERRNG